MSALSPATDIWAVGCIGFELYTGTRLFEDESIIEHFAVTHELPARQQEFIHLMKKEEPEIFSIISGCLQPDASMRLNISQLQRKIGPDPPGWND